MCLLVYPARDLENAKAVIGAVMGDPYVDGSFYVGYRDGDLEVGLDPNGQSAGPIAYWEVDDIRAELKRLLDAGAELVQDAKDVGRGLLVAQVKDAGGSTIGLRQTP
jgi:predicted enzyme related to lactoylglutathione lyase